MKNISFNGKIIGYIENSIFTIYKKPEHFMIKYQGFGVSNSVLNELKEEGVQIIRIVYEGKTRAIYNIPIQNFLNSNLLWNNGGQDLQRFVNIHSFKIENKPHQIKLV